MDDPDRRAPEPVTGADQSMPEVAGSPVPGDASQGDGPAPQPSSTVDEGRRPHPLSPIVQSWIGFVAILVFLLRDVLEQGFDPAEWTGLRLWITLGIVGVILVTTVAVGFISWRYTRFVLDNQGLRIDKNFIEHSSNRVMYTKIQSVDIVQPFAARLIGLASLRVEAGGDAKKIQFLSKADAEHLRDDLMRRAVTAQRTGAAPASVSATGQNADGQITAQGGLPGTLTEPTGSSQMPNHQLPDDQRADHQLRGDQPPPTPSLQEPTRLLVQVRPSQLILAAVTAPEFLVSFVTIVLVGVVPWAITGRIWTAGVLVPAAFGLVSFVSNRVIKEWNYRLTESLSGTVRISRGLTTTVNQTVPHDRIQGFAISQSWLGRLVGLWRVQIEVLGYHDEGEADDSGSTVLLPAGTWAQVLTAVQAIWPGFDPLAIPMQGLPRRGRWLRPLTWKSHRWGVTDDVLVHRGGVIVHTISAVHHSRVQSVRIDQGPLQRRLGLASATAHITDGPVNLTIPDLEAQVASDIVRSELGRAKRALARVTRLEHDTPAPPHQPLGGGGEPTTNGSQPEPHVSDEPPISPRHDLS